MTDIDYPEIVATFRKPMYRNPVGPSNVFTDAADAIEALMAERDALRAQLDNMTTEWGVAFGSLILTEDEGGGGVSEQENRALLEADPSLTLIRRGVTPWVEVTD